MASLQLSIEEQKAVERFRSDVVEPSMTQLVVLDFYADWCGPCKALAPLLEKVTQDYADKGVVLKKVNVDQEQFIAAQFQVQSIPTVYALFQGQPVADLTNARTESQLRQVLDQILTQLPVGDAAAQDGPSAEDIARFIAMGEEVLAGGDGERAAGIFAQVIDMAPAHGPAHAGLVRALVAAGRTDEARAALTAAQADPAVASDPALAQAASALTLAEARVDDGELQILRAASAESPADFEKAYAFAEAAFAAGSRDEAAEVLLKMIADDREWNGGAAKARLLTMFEAIGLEDPWTVATRRRLSRLLFG